MSSLSAYGTIPLSTPARQEQQVIQLDRPSPKAPKRIRKSASALARSRQTSAAGTGTGPMTPPHSVSGTTNHLIGSNRKRSSGVAHLRTLTNGSVDDEAIGPEVEEDFPMIRCGWNNCRQGFWILEDLLEHLVGEKGHIPLDPNAPRGQKCPCEWAGCPKAGKPQGSRMALLVHLRSHTGEKPFCCHKPECDKTFSRTDALAKHVRVSHGEVLPSGRRPGGSSGPAKKVKGEESDAEDLEQGDEVMMDMSVPVANEKKANKDDLLKSVMTHSMIFDDEVDEEFRTVEERKGLEDLKIKFPSTDPAFLEMVIMKAKLKYLLGEKELLEGELKALETKERSIKKQKDVYLDLIMKEQLGPNSSEMWRPSIDSINTLPSPNPAGQLPASEQGSGIYRRLSLLAPLKAGVSSGHGRKRIKTEPGI